MDNTDNGLIHMPLKQSELLQTKKTEGVSGAISIEKWGSYINAIDQRTKDLAIAQEELAKAQEKSAETQKEISQKQNEIKKDQTDTKIILVAGVVILAVMVVSIIVGYYEFIFSQSKQYDMQFNKLSSEISEQSRQISDIKSCLTKFDPWQYKKCLSD